MVHIFDVDNTVIKKTSTECFVRMALREKIFRFSQVSRLPLDWIRYKLGSPDMDFIEQTVKNLSGIDKKALESIAAKCFEKEIKASIFKDAASLIEEALKRNEKVIFATSSFDFIIRPLEIFFGIEGSLACCLEYSEGKTTGKLSNYSYFGAKKKTAAQNWMEKNSVNPKDTAFYSDSYIDIPLLEYCGYPAAVNPDRRLAGRAKASGWKILYFKELLK